MNEKTNKKISLHAIALIILLIIIILMVCFMYRDRHISKKKVPSKELEELKSYIDNLEDSIEITHPGADLGTEAVSVWNFNGEKIKLSLNGDSKGENKTENAQQILKIVNKYIEKSWIPVLSLSTNKLYKYLIFWYYDCDI